MVRISKVYDKESWRLMVPCAPELTEVRKAMADAIGQLGWAKKCVCAPASFLERELQSFLQELVGESHL